MNEVSQQEKLMVYRRFASLLVALIIGLVIGVLSGYAIRAVQKSIHNTQLPSLSESAVGRLGYEIEEYKRIHGSLPDTLNDLDFEMIDVLAKERDLMSKVFYFRSDDSYELVLGIPNAVWTDRDRIVRFR
jgi:hypothetical protein